MNKGSDTAKIAVIAKTICSDSSEVKVTAWISRSYQN